MAPHEAALKPRILVAGAADTVNTACAILGDAFHYLRALSMTDALACLEEGADLVLCGLRFRDREAIDFLEVLRQKRQFCCLPLVCFHAHGWEPSAAACRRLQDLLACFDNAQFVDLYAITCEQSVADARGALRRAVYRGLEGTGETLVASAR